MLAAEGVYLSYGATAALRGASASIAQGEIVAITGRSGSGKSSLLYCLAGISRPDRGRVMFGERDLTLLDDDDLSQCRRQDFGFVFQFGELVPELTLLENTSLPLRLNGGRSRASKSTARAVLSRLGISELADRRPSEVSGGEAQRAAVARALVHEPRVIFADEPTGSLDADNGNLVLAEFLALSREKDATVVLVTHEQSVAAMCDRRIKMVDGVCNAEDQV